MPIRPRSALVVAFTALLALPLACRRLDELRSNTTPAPPDVAPEPYEGCPLPDGTVARFRRHHFPAVGLSFEILDEAATRSPALPQGPLYSPFAPTASGGWLAQPSGQVTLALRYEASATLASWQAEAGPGGSTPGVLGPASRVRVCDHEAVLQDATDLDRAGDAGAATQGHDGSARAAPVGPRRVHRVVAFEHRGLGVLAMWAAPLPESAFARCVRERFYASITCR